MQTAFIARLLIPGVIASVIPSTASAQIINTLRGFDRQALGWSGGVEGTVAIANGNTDYFEFELAASIQHVANRNRWLLMGRYMRRSTSDVRIAENRMTHIRHNFRLTPRFASILFLQGQHDPFRRIETRYLAGAGLRLDVIRAQNWEGAIGGTYMYEDEKLTDDPAGFTADQRFSFFASLYSAESEVVEVDVAAFYQPQVDDFGDARAFTVASVRFNITGALYFLTRYSMQLDSRPPPGVEKADSNLRSGLGYDF